MDVRQGATGPGRRPWATPVQGIAWFGKSNVEFTIFNLVIRLSNLPRVLLICQPFQMCMGSWVDELNQSNLYCLSCFYLVLLPGIKLQIVPCVSVETNLLPATLKLTTKHQNISPRGLGLQVVFLLFGFWWGSDVHQFEVKLIAVTSLNRMWQGFEPSRQSCICSW